ncbi:MAG: NAD(P)-binding domain-containing protein [Phreatobacter sp.]|uniref:flavin-containing monooxygenase n=1 Tax=Phreatobacter sp. TaxID=1966341 RepID=UPI001A487F99|nr:NAD(P)-binding domain-containing protein [Phreatobacter sp.]MBL8569867.1 NAD(P)-binding domain-containing protein [Phreatobacter sp.]
MIAPEVGSEWPGDDLPVVIIGAGQAGLAAGYQLGKRGVAFQIVDAGARVGDSWRRRYASLTLFTPRRYSALPGLTPSGDPDSYPSADEFASYLDEYARHHQLAVRSATRVEKLTRLPDGRFELGLSTGEIARCRSVIIATGGFQTAALPTVAKELGPSVHQLTITNYRTPKDIIGRSVLVVGDGATGRDIATELSATHSVLLATGKSRRRLPERILGRSIWWWLSRTGLLRAGSRSPIGRRMRQADPFPNRGRSLEELAHRGVKIVGRVVGAEGRGVRFSDGNTVEIDSVVWAVGYRDETAWVQIRGAVDDRGQFAHEAGLSPVPGLFFVGRPWQRNRASGLIMGAGDDAAVIAQAIVRTSVGAMA